jgi:hypothetical protein
VSSNEKGGHSHCGIPKPHKAQREPQGTWFMHQNPSNHNENLKETWLMDQKMKRYKTHERKRKKIGKQIQTGAA